MATTSQVEALDCASCGAPLEASASAVTVTCSYCGRTMRVSAGTARATEPDAPRRPVDELLAGYRRDVGHGRRYSVAEMAGRGFRADDPHGVWPVSARASTSFGGGWSPSAIVGRPRVYPRSGDRTGAWAPRARTSHIEWIEARYPEVGPVSAVRVFETHVAGAAFAVTVTGDGGEEIVYQRAPEATDGGARVLEVAIDPPRAVRSARVYITNDSRSWAEIDTIGLVAVDPVPEAVRAQFRRPRSLAPWIVAGLVITAVAAFLWMGSVAGSQARDQPSAPLVTPAVLRSGAVLEEWPVDVDGMVGAGVVWASRAPRASSQYGQEQWSPRQATGDPDTFPAHGDKPTAWASWRKDDGIEWIELSWSSPVDARAIVIVETLNPGALVRVDDLSGEPAIVWQGGTQPVARARVLRIALPQPTRISALRLVLDTRRVAGWNEIDAVGLIPRR